MDLQVHHKKLDKEKTEIKDEYGYLKNDIDSLITLCRSCHMKVHGQYRHMKVLNFLLHS